MSGTKSIATNQKKLVIYIEAEEFERFQSRAVAAGRSLSNLGRRVVLKFLGSTGDEAEAYAEDFRKNS